MLTMHIIHAIIYTKAILIHADNAHVGNIHEGNVHVDNKHCTC